VEQSPSCGGVPCAAARQPRAAYTARTYVSRLLTKLDLANRTQAAILAHEAGLLEG
jgi:DNA-binding NarL/FixJ family response regulator